MMQRWAGRDISRARRRHNSRPNPHRPHATSNSQVAQNWLELRAERSLSAFDQRHLLNLQAQYTTGQGLEGGTLLGGWRGRALKEWTLLSQMTVGTGMPETPTLSRDRSRHRLDRPSASGRHWRAGLRRSGWRAPESLCVHGPGSRHVGKCGTKFHYRARTLSALMARCSERSGPGKHFFLDARIDATNLMNHAGVHKLEHDRAATPSLDCRSRSTRCAVCK